MNRTHELEIANGGPQISIVLASISVEIEVPLFMIASIARVSLTRSNGLLGGLSIL
jgi:hypothetical protein